MSTFTIILIVLLIAAVGFVLALRRGHELASRSERRLHSRPIYHATYVLSWTLVPSLLVLAAWLIVSPIVIGADLRAEVPEQDLAESGLTAELAHEMVSAIGKGLRLLPSDERDQVSETTTIEELVPLLQRRGMPVASSSKSFMIPLALRQNHLEDVSRWLMTAVVIVLALLGAIWGYRRLAVRLRARNGVEAVVRTGLIVCSSIAILTTVGIVLSMIFETFDFFSRVPPQDFFFGTVWDPGFAGAGSGGVAGRFGFIPLFAGTLYISAVAMALAVPVGLFAAIFMAEYADGRTRSIVKPLLEVLAGIPTIVYGFFALITVGPFLRDLSAELAGLVTGNYASFIQAQSVFTAGLVMGIMLIPFVSSLSDDVITAVPQSLRDGSLGLGATESETIKRVILPAALPGIVSALLLTASRAIGETMIVVLAAGVAANLTADPFRAMTTVTVKIVNQLTGDLEFTSPQTLVAFALGMTLFVITLCLNIFALYIVRKYREQYE
ncbi:phosphate ABC transporter permease subunit PstC [Consotaella aegiceratis]|uniref:phosphate ABC transporter permease subunit PstC n=1 Tax=Consotaella aegiceratis TaxID=3097961 RepID=UPI002F3FF955